jgi:hypothetical protein
LLLVDELPAVTQWQIFNYAKRNKDGELLGQLSHHPSLLDEVDQAIAKVPYAKCRAKWLTRPGRTADAVEQAIVTETRITVLKALAELPDLTPAAKAALTKAAIKQDSPALAVQMLATHVMSSADQNSLVGFVAARGISAHLTYHQGHVFRGYLRDHPTLADVALARFPLKVDYTTHDYNQDLSNLLGHGVQLSESTQLRLLDYYFAKRFAKLVPGPQSVVGYQGKARLEWPSAQEQDWGQLNRFVHSQELSDTARARVKQMLDLPNAQVWIKDHSSPAIVALVNYVSTEARTEMLNEATTTDDPVRIADYLGLANEFDHALSLALLANPALTLDQITKAAGLLPTTLVWRTASAMPDTARAATMVMKHLYNAPTNWLGQAVDPKGLLREISLRTTDNRQYWSVALVITALTDEIGNDQEYLLALPDWTLGTDQIPTETRARIAGAVVAALGDNPEAWAVFESFIEGGTGLLLDDAVAAAHLVLGIAPEPV